MKRLRFILRLDRVLQVSGVPMHTTIHDVEVELADVPELEEGTGEEVGRLAVVADVEKLMELEAGHYAVSGLEVIDDD